MASPDVKHVPPPVVQPQVTISADGKVDEAAVQEQSGLATRTGIYNVRTEEGCAAVQKTLLDLGLGMPQFLASGGSTFVSRLSSEAQAALDGLGAAVAGMASSGTTSTTGMSDIQARWAEFVAKNGVSGGGDVNALVQAVLREAYLENTQDLAFYAQKVRFYNELKKSIRDELIKAREYLAEQTGLEGSEALKGTYSNSSGTSAALEFPSEPGFEDGNMVPQSPTASQDVKLETKADLETYIENLEEKLNSVGDDAQLANVDLQNMLQKQQQTLQMMSNIAKMLHDTAMAIIRKIGG